MCNKCNGSCNSCNCTCNSPCTTPDCSCKVFVTTDCVTLKEDLVCSNILKGQTETEVWKQFDTYICERFTSVEEFLKLVNVGTGAGVYKGIDVLGKKQLRSLKSSDNSVIVVEGTDEIDLKVVASDGSDTKIANGTNTTVTGNGTVATPYSISTPTYDGSETKVMSGANVTITGAGTVASPYIVNSSGGAVQGIENVITTDPLITNESIIQLEYGSSFKIDRQVGDSVPSVIFEMTTQNTIASGDYPSTRWGLTDNDGDFEVGFGIGYPFLSEFWAYGGSYGVRYRGIPELLQPESLIHKGYVDNLLSSGGGLFQHQVIEMDVDAAYIASNFDGTGLGTNLMVGMAICNGNNGTKDRTGRVGIGYGTGYTAIGTPGGEKEHVLTVPEMPPHSHPFSYSAAGEAGGGFIVTGGDVIEGGGAFGMTDTGGGLPHNNMQPYIITLFVQKL